MEMLIDRITEDRLMRFFEDLHPSAAAKLVKTIEQGRQEGQNDPVFEVILKHARTVLRDSETQIEHLPTASRKFCQPFEDMLVSMVAGEKQVGRISRNSVLPVWNWLNTRLMPDELPQLATRLEQSLEQGNAENSRKLLAIFYQKISQALAQAIAAVDDMDAERERRRLEAMLGGPQVLADAREMVVAISIADKVEAIKKELPETIIEFDGEILKYCVKLYEKFLLETPDNPEIFISIILKRLKRKGQVLRLAKKIICKDDGAMIAQTPHGVAGEILLFDMEVAAEHLATTINRHDLASTVLFSLREFHVLAKGMTSEVRIDMKGKWGLRIVTVRKQVTDLLEREISIVPRLIRQALLGKKSIGKKKKTAVPVASLDPLDMVEAVRVLKILVGAQFLADQISLNATISRFIKEIKQYLDSITERNISLIKEETGKSGKRAIESLEGTVKLVRIIQGDDMAELITRRGQAAQANIPHDEALAS